MIKLKLDNLVKILNITAYMELNFLFLVSGSSDPSSVLCRKQKRPQGLN